MLERQFQAGRFSRKVRRCYAPTGPRQLQRRVEKFIRRHLCLLPFPPPLESSLLPGPKKLLFSHTPTQFSGEPRFVTDRSGSMLLTPPTPRPASKTWRCNRPSGRLQWSGLGGGPCSGNDVRGYPCKSPPRRCWGPNRPSGPSMGQELAAPDVIERIAAWRRF